MTDWLTRGDIAPPARLVLHALVPAGRTGLTFAALLAGCGLADKTLRRALAWLVMAGLVQARREGAGSRFRIREGASGASSPPAAPPADARSPSPPPPPPRRRRPPPAPPPAPPESEGMRRLRALMGETR
jgi:hypothetical protein